MNCSAYDGDDIDILGLRFREMMKTQPKFRYILKQIAGDYYYEKLTIEEAVDRIFLRPESDDKILRNQKDIDEYVRDNINIRMPLDGPLVRVYLQKYEPDDQENTPENLKPKSILIWKCHHSFCDGVSVTSMVLALSEEYDRSYFLSTKDASWAQAIGLRLMTPFLIPTILMSTIFAKADSNFITKKRGGEDLSGVMNVDSSTQSIDVNKLKTATKKLNVTINDVVMCALTTSLNKIFKRNGDTTKDISLLIPANIRFKFYPTREQVVLENKFAAIPIIVPLTETMESSYEKIKKVTKALKGSFGLIYGVYAMSFWSVKLLPRWICHAGVEYSSRKFSVAFSNTPGPVKSFKYRHPETGNKIQGVSS